MKKSIDSSISQLFLKTYLAGRPIRSRLAFAPMTTYSSLPSGQINPEELPYYERRSKGGYGLVLTAACCVHPSGLSFDGQWRCDSDEFLESLASVAKVINGAGANSILQIHHGGRMAPSKFCGEPVSASAIPAVRPNAETPRELTTQEIEELIDAYAQAANRAYRAGYHGVEIHGANTYLLQQFVSPHSNRRDDEYGQDRLLFSKKIIERVSDSVPDGFILGYRFSPEEIETPGIRLQETNQLVNMLADSPLHFLHISLGSYDKLSNDQPELGPLTSLVSSWIAGRKPFMTSGSMKSMESLQLALELGADYFAIGRQAIIEPDFPEKIKNGESIRQKYPRKNSLELLTMPTSLDHKILTLEGWFEVEPE